MCSIILLLTTMLWGIFRDYASNNIIINAMHNKTNINNFRYLPFARAAWQCGSADEYAKGHCIKCTTGTCATMGYRAAETNPRGNFYLMTEASPTFCGSPYCCCLI